MHVIDPYPSDWLKQLETDGLTLNMGLPEAPAVVCACHQTANDGRGLETAERREGWRHAFSFRRRRDADQLLRERLGAGARIVRTMPNTPALVGRGISALVANDAAKGEGELLATTLMSSVGQAIQLDGEDDLHAVTALSGSGPAYVFAFIEALVKAGSGLGLKRDMALKLARETIIGAGMMVGDDPDEVATLRRNVTSPNGTTAAGLSVLQRQEVGIDDLIAETLRAAATAVSRWDNEGSTVRSMSRWRGKETSKKGSAGYERQTVRIRRRRE